MAGYDRESRGYRPSRSSTFSKGGGGFSVSVSGLSDLEAALAALPRAASRATMRRALLQAGQPVADRAKEIVRRRTGALADSISVSTKGKNVAGAAAYSATLADGGSKSEAGIALRSATKSAKSAAPDVEVFIGPSGKIKYAHLVEFGTVHSRPFPYMRPAWEGLKVSVLANIQTFLATEITKTAKRVARRAARLAAKG